LKFAFTALIQADLDKMVTSWNTHYIRNITAVHNNVHGIPDELFYLPEVRGEAGHTLCTHTSKNLTTYIGCEDYSKKCYHGDLQLAWLYAQDKPPPTATEFTNLAKIVMEEENIEMPQNPEEGLNLYFELLNAM
jgi:hypothetical protein